LMSLNPEAVLEFRLEADLAAVFFLYISSEMWLNIT